MITAFRAENLSLISLIGYIAGMLNTWLKLSMLVTGKLLFVQGIFALFSKT
jgi:hypothetical protein